MSTGGSQAMAGIEPHSVLEQLDPLLGQTGCIRSTKEVAKIVSLMKAAQLLVVRSVILSIIKATRAPSTLERFMEVGWPVLNVWLAEAKKTQDTAVLVEVLQVLQKLPVSVAALKQGNMGKLIKQLSKQEHQGQISTPNFLLVGCMHTEYMCINVFTGNNYVFSVNILCYVCYMYHLASRHHYWHRVCHVHCMCNGSS
jgi:protein phosphatase 1 regulatory subunit 10